ncbi:hypothetical protein NDU88_004054 [Pleurodeles waltl]|uniref:Secreted protein n=1 Tax=Pleurodeles waltl TaxID=8319 RepID=A0AAV7VIU7_PLEWA|nr:hypothetical protein NDU88_004054 [Pleurodeles waltl]
MRWFLAASLASFRVSVFHRSRGPPPLCPMGQRNRVSKTREPRRERAGLGAAAPLLSRHTPVSGPARTLVRGSGEIRRLHPLRRPRSQPPPVVSRKLATP